MLSIIVPCHNEEAILNEFHKVLKDAVAGIASSEILYIDDGSTDGTAQSLQRILQNDSSARVIQFTRNFGKEAGIYAGLEHAAGDYVCIIDADLQQPPCYIPAMLEKLENSNYDMVAMCPTSKTKGSLYHFGRKVFHSAFKKLAHLDLSHGASDFRMFTSEVQEALLSISERTRFTKGIFSWIGFSTLYMEYHPEDRSTGKTHWSLKSLTSYGIDGIVSFSTAPLRFLSIIGMVFCIASFIYALTVIIQALRYGTDVPGYPSLIVAVIFFGGAQLFALGVLGEYISKTYIEAKRRPIYLARKTLDFPLEKESEPKT